MRILHVNKFLRSVGGAETHMFSVASLQRDEGHDVEFFGMEHPDNDPSVGAVLGTDLALAPAADLRSIPSGRRQQVREATSLIWNERARRAMSATLDAFEPDVVHMHNVYHQLSPSILEPIKGRAATVMTLHDYKLACPTYTFLSHGELCQDCIHHGFRSAVRRRCQDGSLVQSSLLALESRIHRTLRSYRAVDRFLCPSRFLEAAMQEAGVFPDRLRHLPNFVLPADSGPTEPEEPTAVFVGRLSHEKGVDVLIDAAKLLRSTTRVTIVGDGPEDGALRARAEQTASPARLVGRLSQPEVRDLLSRASVMIVPSRWHENQPISILEALSQQVPVISTDLGGLPELVIDGETGATVPADDPKALAAAIDRVVNDESARRRMGRNGAELVAREHAPKIYMARLNAQYQEVLGRG